MKTSKNKPLLLFFILLFFSSALYAQISGDELYAMGNYKEAIPKFLLRAKAEKNNPDWNYKLGKCYLESNVDKTKAVPYLEVASKNSKDLKVWKDLGRAYHYANEFDMAIDCYKKCKEKATKKDADQLDRLIEMCNNGKELVAKPLNVTFQNVGKAINSPFPDYYPFIPFNESCLVFTTRRTGGGLKEDDGFFTSDIYISEVKNGQFAKAKSAGLIINTQNDEQCVGLTPDGKKMIIYIDHQEEFGDIYLTEANAKRQFAQPVPFPETINSGGIESAASINTEGNLLVFASDRPGGFGGSDIYFARILPDGTWGAAENLGPAINTIYEEDFPQLSEDGKTLYFSSQGHNSMGGYDIFKSTFNEKTKKWGVPKNIGYPINTTDDDMHYAVSANQREAYISCIREGGFGDLDIWKVVFNEVDSKKTFVRGAVFLDDTLHYATEDINISIKNINTNTNITDPCIYKAVNKKFSIALGPGKYKLSIIKQGYQPFEKNIDILDKVDFKQDITLKLVLLPELLQSKIPKSKPTLNKNKS